MIKRGFILLIVVLFLGCQQKLGSTTDSNGEQITWNLTAERTDDYRTWEERKNDGWSNKTIMEEPLIPNITGTPAAENILKIDNSTKIGRQASTEEQKLAPPLIKNLGVTFADYDPSTKKAGDFLFTTSKARPLGEFGQPVLDERGSTKLLPHYTYWSIPPETPVMAIADGDVVAVRYEQETNDYGVHIRPVYDSYWDFNYDHLSRAIVKENDTVKSGEIIGYAGSQLEIAVVFEKDGSGTFYPLLPYFDPLLKNEYEQQVWNLLSDWEAYKGNSNIYDEKAMVPCPACLQASLPDVYSK